MRRRDVLAAAFAATPLVLDGRYARAGGLTLAPHGVPPADGPSTTSGRLGTIRAITIPAPDLSMMEAAYSTFLGYRTVWRGVASSAAAASWGAPSVAGRRMMLMGSGSGDPTYFRFIEQAPPASFDPLTTFGWTAAELAVQDVDALALRLERSPFSVIGPPRELTGFTGIKAMQATGPAGEVLYFTHFAPRPGRPPPMAPKSFVDFCFVAVIGAPDMTAELAFYHDHFGNRPGQPFEIVNEIISRANHLPLGTRHRLATIALDGHKLVEVDQFPPNAAPRITRPGELPPGIAMVTFDYPSLNNLDPTPLTPPVTIGAPPYGDHRSATALGGVGERIELVEVDRSGSR